MIDLIFFNFESDFEKTAKKVYETLSITNILTGDSLHVVDGEYKISSILGINIKLEKNGYDWEEDYQYMLSIQKDFLSKVEISDNCITLFSKIICEIITTNLKIEVAYEKNNELIIFKLTDKGE